MSRQGYMHSAPFHIEYLRKPDSEGYGRINREKYCKYRNGELCGLNDSAFCGKRCMYFKCKHFCIFDIVQQEATTKAKPRTITRNGTSHSCNIYISGYGHNPYKPRTRLKCIRAHVQKTNVNPLVVVENKSEDCIYRTKKCCSRTGRTKKCPNNAKCKFYLSQTENNAKCRYNFGVNHDKCQLRGRLYCDKTLKCNNYERKPIFVTERI